MRKGASITGMVLLIGSAALSCDNSRLSPGEAPSRDRTEEQRAAPAAKKVPDADFRGVLWGMSREEVRAAEDLPFVGDTDGGLSFGPIEVADLNTLVLYSFAENQLVQASYAVLSEHTDDGHFIGDRDRLEKLLRDKYGNPVKDDTIWANRLFQDDPTRWGTALAAGHLFYVTKWRSPKTEVELILGGDNFKTSMFVHYRSVELAQLREATERKMDAEGL